jgi:uncharacterized damage-inducible protein DinB
MPIAESLLPEFDQEMAATRKVLERVPSENTEWKPHPKSFSIGHLMQLVAGMPSWMRSMLREPGLDLSRSPGYSYEPPAELLAAFDKNVQEARELLKATTDEDLASSWSLMMGDRVLMSMPRGAVIRQHFNHMVHHRAQLGVYLRLRDVPVPCMYGPTADERM